MKKYRNVVTYRSYFDNFLNSQSVKVVSKVLQILRIIETIEVIPANYLKHIDSVKGLYEIRVNFASNIFRIFCCFDSDRLVVLLTAFQKKTQKTPLSEIKRAQKILTEYLKEKEGSL